MKTAELTGPALDWAVAKCEGFVQDDDPAWERGYEPFAFSIDWSQGGPIIERMFKEGFQLSQGGLGAGNQRCWASRNVRFWSGPTPLIAAMRCYVASKLGDTVDIPSELL